MKRANMWFAALAFLVVWPAAAAELDVNATAAQVGNFGLEVRFNGTTQAAYVVDTTPNNETTYRAEWLITASDTFDYETSLPQPTPALRQKSHNMMFNVKDFDNFPPDRLHISIHLKKANWGGGVFRLIVWTRAYAPLDPQAVGDDWAYRNHLGEAMEVALPTHSSGYPVSIRFEWQEESAPGAADGKWCLWRANNFAPGVYGGRCHEQLRNNGHNIDQIELGAVGGVDTGTVGSYYFDEFQSFRTLAP